MFIMARSPTLRRKAEDMSAVDLPSPDLSASSRKVEKDEKKSFEGRHMT
jgi:hypothetical protein